MIPQQEWDAVLRVNVSGAFLCCQAVVPLMRRAGRGKIVNISSATIWTGRPNYLHYVTSKAALIGFTRALASEVGSAGITVNAVTPGSTETEVERATITAQARATMAAQTALRRGASARRPARRGAVPVLIRQRLRHRSDAERRRRPGLSLSAVDPLPDLSRRMLVVAGGVQWFRSTPSTVTATAAVSSTANPPAFSAIAIRAPST